MARTHVQPVAPEFRFWVKVTPVDSGCWEWRAARNECGYGIFCPDWQGSRSIRAHRYAYELCVGPIPERLPVLHSCDNPACVRPDHLRVGTMKENSEDMMRRGRNRNQNTDKTHCKRGHELIPSNVYVTAKGRNCRQCGLDWHHQKTKAS